MNENTIRRLLSAARAKCQKKIEDGSWRRDFPGKELFRSIAGKMCKKKQTPELHVDLAKEIALRQFERESESIDESFKTLPGIMLAKCRVNGSTADDS